MKILFVCLGNICRSPIADGIMRDLVAEQGLDWEIDSAGTSREHAGEQPDRRAIRVAQKHGVDISDLRARQFALSDFERFDKIYAMDTQNLRNVEKQARTEKDRKKVELFLTAAFPGQKKGVPDPWYDDELFEPVYEEIQEACGSILTRLIESDVTRSR